MSDMSVNYNSPFKARQLTLGCPFEDNAVVAGNRTEWSVFVELQWLVSSASIVCHKSRVCCLKRCRNSLHWNHGRRRMVVSCPCRWRIGLAPFDQWWRRCFLLVIVTNSLLIYITISGSHAIWSDTIITWMTQQQKLYPVHHSQWLWYFQNNHNNNNSRLLIVEIASWKYWK